LGHLRLPRSLLFNDVNIGALECVFFFNAVFLHSRYGGEFKVGEILSTNQAEARRGRTERNTPTRFCTSAGTRYSRLTGPASRSPQASRWTMKHHSASLASCTGTRDAALGRSAVVFGQRSERRLQRASQPAKRGGLLLRDFVVERDNAL
jgi:hypothetical protein